MASTTSKRLALDDYRRLFQHFEPHSPLRLDESDLYVSRGESVVDEFRQGLRFPVRRRFLLAGAVGCGKSTELLQLLKRMETDETRVTRHLDLWQQFDPPTMTAAQILFLIAASVLSIADLPKRDRVTWADRLRKGYEGVVESPVAPFELGKLLSGLSLLAASAASGPAGWVAASAAATVADSMGTRLALPGKGRVLGPSDPRARAMTELLSEVVQAARHALNQRRILLLIDGLDKIEESQVADLFGSGVLACLDVEGLDLVFTAPAALPFRVGTGERGGFQIVRLDLFNVVERDGSTKKQQVERMREAVIRRIRAAEQDPAAVLPAGRNGRAAVETAILQSGGLIRDLMHIFQQAIMVASDATRARRLTAQDLQTGAEKKAKDYLYRLTLGSEEILRQVWLERQRPDGALSDKLLNDNLILCYDNGNPWCRPHPLVLPRLRERFPELSNVG